MPHPLTRIICQYLDSPVETLANHKPLIDEMCAILCNITGMDLNPTVMSERNTATAKGNAVSPVVAGRCAWEILRSQVFIRGVYAAIRERLDSPDRAADSMPLNILYAGTGPFGLLIVPLLPLLSAKEVQITLLDIHDRSLTLLNKLIDELGVRDRIAAIHCTDILKWPAPAAHYDLVVSETMTAMLKAEPQVAIFAHLVSALKPSGSLIPEQIQVNASLLAAGTFDEQSAIPLGRMFSLDRQTALAIASGDERCFSAQLVIPEHPAHYTDLQFTTEIVVYGDHSLTRGQCSLTMPFTRHKVRLEIGSTLESRYVLNDRPDFEIRYKVTNAVNYDTPVDSSDCSMFGIPHAKRLWQKVQLLKLNRLDPGIVQSEQDLDLQCYRALGLQYPDDLAELFSKDSLSEFESWVMTRNQSLSNHSAVS